MEDLVSIIIPVYNASRYIRQTLHSIEKQTDTNYEVIVLDDASTDESRKIVETCQKKNAKIKMVCLKKHKGVAIARNIGIRKAKGRYLVFLDADDLFVEKRLEWQKAFLQKNAYAFGYGSFCYVNDAGDKMSNPVKVPSYTNYERSLLDMRILIATVMIDLTKIPKRDCYMPNVMNEDIATWWKMLKKGYCAHGQKEVLAYYRKTKHSRSSQKIVTAKGRWFLYRNLENLSVLKSAVCFSHYLVNAIRKRSVQWHKIPCYKKDDLQVLVAVQNKKDDSEIKELLQKMKIKSNYLMVNQCEESMTQNPYVLIRNESGLSKSRNQAIRFSNGQILLLADDDVEYQEDYVETIVKYHNQFKEADIICFYVESRNKKRKTRRLRNRKNWLFKGNEGGIF